MKLEFRDITGGIKDYDAETRSVNVFFPHDVVDSFKTVFVEETFQESLARRAAEDRLPVMAWQHMLKEPIGRGARYQITRPGTELVGVFDDFDAVPLARRAHAQILSGTLKDFSFGFERTGPVTAWKGQRGVRAFTSADMAEFSPVTIGSIPGAGATDIREAAMELDEITIPSREEIMQMREAGLIDDDSAREMIKATLPEELRAHIRLITPPQAEPETRAPDTTVGPDDGHKVDRVDLLAQAVDAALDRAIQLFQANGSPDLSPELRQAIDLVYAAGVSIDELLETGGIDDPDDDYRADPADSIETVGPESLEWRSSMSQADRNALPGSDFGYIEPSAKQGDDVPKSPANGYHFPIHDAAHVRNALARIAQGAEYGSQAKAKVVARAHKLGIDVSDDMRSTEEGDLETPEGEVEDGFEPAKALAEAVFARRLG